MSESRSKIPMLAALALGFVLAGLLFADPFDLHSLDEWLRGERVGVRGEGAPAVLPGHEGHEHAALPVGALEDPEGTLYTCGMHPQVIQEEPGFCPICSMALVPIEGTGAWASGAGSVAATEWVCTDFPQAVFDEPGVCPIDGTALVPRGGRATRGAGGGKREILFYRNPMNPTVTSPVPAKDEMGMDYVPVYSDEVSGHQGAIVTIDPAVVQNMNVTTAQVERRDLVRHIRTVGYLDYDQQKMVTVTTKYRGWVEKVYVNYIGEPVRKGQKLFEVYAPELVQTQQELLSALDFADRMERAPGAAPQRADDLVEAARRRLGYWDIGPDLIAEIERTGEPLRTLPVVAPAGGVVMKRVPGLQGMAVAPGQELFHIADLSSLWVSVEVFEDQLPWLREGASAQVRLDYFPGETFRGRVRFIEPEVSEETRTVSLRLEVPNRDGRLRAGMYATVTFEPTAARGAVAVPALSVLRTGQRNVVVVALGGGRFAPRNVLLGVSADGWYQVLEGLQEGETVVTSAQFLIDSESNLREAIQKMVTVRQGGA